MFSILKIYCKGLNNLIAITKPESERVRKVFPRAEIVRTCIQKSKRHHYYLPEAEKYLRLIVDSNYAAASICQRIDKERERSKRNRYRH